MKKKILAGILVTTLATTTLLFGCGKKEDSTGASTGEKEKITFMLDWTANTNHTGLYVAEKLGYFDEAGLEVEIVECSEAGAEASVASGAADFGVSFQDYLVPAYSAEEGSRLPITTVAALIQHNTSGIVSLKETGIESAKDMSGHSYATWDLPIEQAIIKKVVNDDGGNFDDIELISTYVEDIKAALSSDIDSVWIYYAWDGIACELGGLDTNFFLFTDYGKELDEYSPVIIANDDFLKNKPEVTKKFLAAVEKGYKYAIENPEDAAEILVDANDGLDPEICKASQKWLADQYVADAAKWGVIDKDRWDAFYTWVYENDLCEYEIPSGYGFSNDYLPE